MKKHKKPPERVAPEQPRALKSAETITAAYDPLVDRLHVIEKIEQIFLGLRCLDERFHCSRIVVERVIAEAIKSGLVQYNGPKPLGTFEQRRALKEVLSKRYLLVVDSGEPDCEGSLGLLMKATGYREARVILSTTPYAHWFLSYHGRPTPDLILHGKWRGLKLIWIPELEQMQL